MASPRERKKANPVGNVDDFNRVIIQATIKNLELSLGAIRSDRELIELCDLIKQYKEKLKNAR